MMNQTAVYRHVRCMDVKVKHVYQLTGNGYTQRFQVLFVSVLLVGLIISSYITRLTILYCSTAIVAYVSSWLLIIRVFNNIVIEKNRIDISYSRFLKRKKFSANIQDLSLKVISYLSPRGNIHYSAYLYQEGKRIFEIDCSCFQDKDEFKSFTSHLVAY